MHLPDNFISLDTETSSLDPVRGSLLSLGAVKANGDPFYGECRPWAGALLDPESIGINGYDPDCWDGTRSETELLEAFLCWLGDPPRGGTRWVMGGRNPRFDYEFLNAALKRGGSALKLSAVISRRVIDLHPVVYLCGFQSGINIGEDGLTTRDLHERLGLPLEGRPHNALIGARMSMEVFGQLEVALPCPSGA